MKTSSPAAILAVMEVDTRCVTLKVNKRTSGTGNSAGFPLDLLLKDRQQFYKQRFKDETINKREQQENSWGKNKDTIFYCSSE